MLNPETRLTLRRRIALLACLGLLTFAAGCSAFEREWSRSMESQQAENSPEGCWEGSWISDHNAHTGSLRCIISRQDDGRYRTWYKARWAKIFTFTYTLDIALEGEAPRFDFAGEETLGWPWGVYKYRGEINGTRFHSRYEADVDRGSFQMTRAVTP